MCRPRLPRPVENLLAAMLTLESAAQHLISIGLLHPEVIVSGSVTIKGDGRRNNNIRIELADGQGYFVKQPGDKGAAETITTEALFYQYAATAYDWPGLQNLLPTLVSFQPKTATLITRLVPKCQRLWECYRHADPAEAKLVAYELGKALASIHNYSPKQGLPDSISHVRSSPPWILGIHEPTVASLATLSAANLDMIAILQEQREMTHVLDNLRQSWSAHSIIHGDIKGDNILWTTGGETGAIKLVDWEMIQVGDSCWDVGGVFQDALLHWILSLPDADSIDGMISASSRSLKEVHSVIRSFCRGYSEIAPAVWGSNEVARAAQMTGARLIQSIYEMCSRAAELSLRALLAIQLCERLLADTELAQMEVLGILDAV